MRADNTERKGSARQSCKDRTRTTDGGAPLRAGNAGSAAIAGAPRGLELRRAVRRAGGGPGRTTAVLLVPLATSVNEVSSSVEPGPRQRSPSRARHTRCARPCRVARRPEAATGSRTRRRLRTHPSVPPCHRCSTALRRPPRGPDDLWTSGAMERGDPSPWRCKGCHSARHAHESEHCDSLTIRLVVEQTFSTVDCQLPSGFGWLVPVSIYMTM